MPVGPVLYTFMQYSIAFCSRPEAANGATSGIFVGPIVANKNAKFDGHRTSGSRKISPEGVGGGIIDVFRHNFRPEVVSDVVSSVIADPTGLPHFVRTTTTTTTTTPAYACHHIKCRKASLFNWFHSTSSYTVRAYNRN